MPGISRSRWPALGALALVAALIIGVGSARAGRPAITLALTANVKGLLTTCKTCSYVTIGGMAEKATMFKDWNTATGGAFTALDAGDWSAFGARFSNNVTMIAAMRRLGYVAANVGDSEAAFGQRLFDAATQHGLPLVSANLLEAQNGRRVLPAEIITTVRGVRIGVIGVIGPQASAGGFALPARYRLADVRKTLADGVPKLRPRCEILVVLAHVPLPEAKRLAKEVPGIDLLVGGSVHGKVPDGELVGQTLVVEPHRYAVVLVKMAPGPSGRYRATKWPSYVVPRKKAADPEMAALIERGLAQPGGPAAPGPLSSSYVGADKCAACHGKIHAAWKRTPHARAWHSLARGSPEMPTGQQDPKCWWCHTTSLPGAAASNELKGVQCEACHGPFSLHEQRYVKGDYRRSADEWRRLCRTCHDPKNSPEFDFAQFRAEVAKEGHGKK